MNWKFWERRGSKSRSRDPYTAQHFGIRENSAGEMVTPDTAAAIPMVHACVQTIAETVATLPLHVFRRADDGGKETDTRHPLHRVLHEQANQVQTAMEFREQFVASAVLTGNGYAFKVINGRGAVTELLPLHPGSVSVEKLPTGRIRYQLSSDTGGTQTYTQDEILHLRYRSKDGITGISPIQAAREAIGVALAQQRYEGGALKNGFNVGGVLQFSQNLNDENRKQVTRAYTDAFAGPTKMGRLMVLDGGTEYKPMTINNRDAEFIAQRRLTLEDIARIFRIPAPVVGILEDATYSNISEQARWLVMHTLRPWLVRIEQAMNASLLSIDGRRTHFIEHNAEGLLRGNQAERFESYRQAREWGWMSVNEIRRRENMNGIGEAGDTYRQPMNTEPLGQAAE